MVLYNDEERVLIPEHLKKQTYNNGSQVTRCKWQVQAGTSPAPRVQLSRGKERPDTIVQ